ncbi:hypothetical protein [Paraburkholderia sp. RAU2J]|uniref:hypothetical protein n=1 Tax=Paraburkholderia sp. RAU2J TaxID=1938810 RepID=UPI0011C42BCA|nr:hypothetical protein [Paraburkholderia sp. RAU2J]
MSKQTKFSPEVRERAVRGRQSYFSFFVLDDMTIRHKQVMADWKFGSQLRRRGVIDLDIGYSPCPLCAYWQKTDTLEVDGVSNNRFWSVSVGPAPTC